MQRYINFSAIINFGFTLQAGWEAIGVLFGMAILNGGPAAYLYGCVIALVGSTSIALCLGEMASIDPNVGAQYRWTALFAPKHQEFFALVQGSISLDFVRISAHRNRMDHGFRLDCRCCIRPGWRCQCITGCDIPLEPQLQLRFLAHRFAYVGLDFCCPLLQSLLTSDSQCF